MADYSKWLLTNPTLSINYADFSSGASSAISSRKNKNKSKSNAGKAIMYSGTKRGAKTKLRLINYDWRDSFKDVMFNPTKFGDTKSANYGTINAPMQSYPRHVYQGGNVSSLTGVELYYNDENPAKVRELVIWLQDFLPYQSDGISIRVPPTLLFSWGGWYVKRCILKSMDTEYTMFNEELQPTECTIHLDLEIMPIGSAPYTPQPWEVGK